MMSMLKATMYFSYGRDARSGLNLKTTFDAILASERNSTTRFPSWPGYERWKALKVGDHVRFYADRDMKGRYVDVTVTEVPRIIDLAQCSEAELAAWSQAEGWSKSAGRGYVRKYGPGLQIRYRPLATAWGAYEKDLLFPALHHQGRVHPSCPLHHRRFPHDQPAPHRAAVFHLVHLDCSGVRNNGSHRPCP